MGESLGRIKTWVQEHPLIAALILGAVVLVGYLVYRSRAAAGGGATDQGTAPTDQGAQPGADQGTVPSPVPLPIPQPVETGGGGGGGGHVGHVGNINGGSGGGISFPPDMTGIGDYGLPTQIPVVPIYGEGTQFPLPRAGFQTPQTSDYTPRPAPRVGFQTPQTSQYTPPKAGLNPAQQAGKGAHFTGFINGVYYVNGYPSPNVIQQGGTVISTTGNVAPVVTGGRHKA